MRLRTSRIALTTAVVGVAALTLGLSSTAAHADTGARPGDVVGVGSDTLQNAADFILDAGGNGAGGGYNSIGNINRVFNYYATGDANGRATYDGTCTPATGAPAIATVCSSTNAGTPDSLAGTVILRGGDNPVLRPNGSGAGVGALISDASGEAGYEGLALGSIQYARMSRLPNSTEEGECLAPTVSNPNPPCGGLHVYQFATDSLAIAHITTGFNGPTTGLSVADLVQIYEGNYTKWNQIPGNSAGSSALIDPLIPQSGSGTRNFFLADLQAANGGTAITLGGDVRTVEEHDPDGIYQAPIQGNAIEPFSTGKLALINSGYFSAGGPAFAKNLLTAFPAGNTADGTNAATYFTSRGLYFTIRNTDLASTTPFQPGGTLNWAQTLFGGGTVSGTVIPAYIASSKAAAGIEAAGFTPAYKDCGVNPTTC